MNHHTTKSNPRSLLSLFAWILIAFIPSLTGAFFSPDAWYESLTRPEITPPGWVFGPVWTALYFSIGLAAWLWFGRARFGAAPALWTAFAVQWTLNLSWTPLFFGAHNIGAALIVIIALWCSIIACIFTGWRIHRTAAALFIPYTAWVTFATLLNYRFWQLNT